MSSLGAAVAAGPSRLLPRSPVSVPLGIDTDTFPVAVAVRNLHQSENIAVAAVYLVFAVFLILRLLFPRKAVAFHRRAAYSLFVMACAGESDSESAIVFVAARAHRRLCPSHLAGPLLSVSGS